VDRQADPATYGDPEADVGFTVARARFGMDGFVPMAGISAAHQLDYAISVGIASPYDVLGTRDEDVQIVDAFARWALPWSLGVTSASAGIQRVPFSREAMISSANLVFQERAVGTEWLTPGREAGVQVTQSLTFSDDQVGGPQVLVRGGVFNGNGDMFGDDDPGVLGAGRAEFILGDTYRTWSHDLEPALGGGVSALYNDEVATSTFAWQADLLARYSVITVMGEAIQATISPTETTIAPPAVAGVTRRTGYLGQLSVYVPAFEASGFELAGRFATFDDAVQFRDNGDVLIVHAGATWRDLLPKLDVGAGYIHRGETVEVPNDTVRVWVQLRPEGGFTLR
jgi:hypothetical protein